MKRERKSRGGKFSHITRGLNADTPLTGKTLELVLEIIGDGKQGKLLDDIANKLKTGQSLTSEEHSYMVDAVLVRARLS